MAYKFVELENVIQILVIQILGAGIATDMLNLLRLRFVLFLQATNRECVALSGRDFLILKADKDQRNWGRATAE